MNWEQGESVCYCIIIITIIEVKSMFSSSSPSSISVITYMLELDFRLDHPTSLSSSLNCAPLPPIPCRFIYVGWRHSIYLLLTIYFSLHIGLTYSNNDNDNSSCHSMITKPHVARYVYYMLVHGGHPPEDHGSWSYGYYNHYKQTS